MARSDRLRRVLSELRALVHGRLGILANLLGIRTVLLCRTVGIRPILGRMQRRLRPSIPLLLPCLILLASTALPLPLLSLQTVAGCLAADPRLQLAPPAGPDHTIVTKLRPLLALRRILLRPAALALFTGRPDHTVVTKLRPPLDLRRILINLRRALIQTPPGSSPAARTHTVITELRPPLILRPS